MSSQQAEQSDIMRKNVAALAEMQRQALAQRSVQDRAADAITDFAGSMAFVYVHAVWFGLWVLLNVGLLRVPHLTEFDPFPFGLLTMVVSLEAIFLSTFILVSQNRQAKLSERRAEIDLQVNMLAEQKATKVLEMLDQMAQQLDASSRRFNFTPDPEVEALKVSPEPGEVIRVIEEEVAAQAEEIINKVEEVSETTAEIKGDVRDLDEKLSDVAEDVEEIKKDSA
jgi:uncharacterized membrane protein